MLSGVIAWVHIASVVLAIGGLAFVFLVLRPLALKTFEPPVAMSFLGEVMLRFRWVTWSAIALLIVTGVWMSWAFRGVTTVDALFASSFGRTLALKSLLAIVLFVNALGATLPLPTLPWFRRHAVAFFWINIMLAAVIILLASLMVRNGGLL